MKIRNSNLQQGLLDKALEGLTNVEITDLANGQVLKYNSTSSKWVNAADNAGGGGPSGVSLTDFSVTTDPASGGGSLTYDNTTGEFTFAPADIPAVPADISELTDTTNLLDPYVLPIASPTVLGGVKIGTGLSIDVDGIVSTGGSASFSSVTVTGTTYTNQVIESFQTYSTTISSGGTVSVDAGLGQVINVTASIGGNFTLNLTNLGLTAGKATNVTAILNQGATGYIISALQIGGSGQTINWQGNAVPSGNANKKDAFAFSILCTATNTYTVFGQLVSFG